MWYIRHTKLVQDMNVVHQTLISYKFKTELANLAQQCMYIVYNNLFLRGGVMKNVIDTPHLGTDGSVD